MNRADALDRIPLLASGDLDAGQRAEVEAAIANDLECQDELAYFETLDGWLQEAYPPPAAEPAWPTKLDTTRAAGPGAADEAAPLLVRRQCPFCHDSLASEEVVFCTQCATPHHAPCFSENHGCALLGCGGVESVATRSAASRICTGCQGHTPANAPFCAWCGSPLADDAQPRHHRPVVAAPPLDLRKFLTAAAALLVACLGVGGLFGLREQSVLGALRDQAYALERAKAEDQARALLQQVLLAQREFLEKDLDGDGVLDFATDFEELARCVAFDGASRNTYFLLHCLPWTAEIEVFASGRGDAADFGAVVRPSKHFLDTIRQRRTRWGGPAEPRAFSIDPTGAIRTVTADPVGRDQ